MKTFKILGWRTSKWVAGWMGFVVLLVIALVEVRKKKNERPKIFWGPAPLINIKYHSQAVKRLGYDSVTVVDNTYAINVREDFDFLTEDIINLSKVLHYLPAKVKQLLRSYYLFVWAIHRYDIFNFYFTGGILQSTPLKYMELFLLKVAGKKTVMTAYGGDVQLLNGMRNLLYKHAFVRDYPDVPWLERQTRRDIGSFALKADYIIAGADWVDYLPRWDKLVSAHFAIDTEVWKPSLLPVASSNSKVVKVFHAPNHRNIKGTSFLIQTCKELKEEGVPVELVLMEGVPNTRIYELMQECDIVADQFIVGWYAMFALEGMSMGKPVLTYLRPDLLELYTLYSWAGECPLMNTHPLHIKETLRELVEHPALRAEIGAKGRAYVEKYHSLAAIGKMFDEIYQEIWPPLKTTRTS